MADIRINSLPSTATSFNTDDYIAIDGTSGGTRKMLAANPPFTDVTLGASGPSVKSTLSARAPRQGLVFDGTAGATVTLPAFGTNDFTVAVWLRADVLAAKAVVDGNGGLLLDIGSNGAFRFYRRSTPTSLYDSAAGVLVAGKTNLLVYSRGSVYLNGVALQTGISDTANYTGSISHIGSSYVGGDPITGFVSALVYNRALSGSEVVALYEAGAPSGADYRSPAAGTALITGADSNFSSDTGFWTKSGTAAITGGKAVLVNAGDYFVRNYILQVGQRYRATATISGYTGGTIWFTDANGNGVTATANGTYTADFVATSTSIYMGGPSAVASFDDVTLVPLGLLLAPDAAQAGGGLVWYDTSGNAANITLPASGVSWNVPSSRYLGGNWTTSGNLTVNAGAVLVDGPALGGGAQVLRFNNTNTPNSNRWAFVQRSIAEGDLGLYDVNASAFRFYLNSAGNFLVGKTIDSANGKLQLAESTASTAGIGFGPDVSLYRSNAGYLTLLGTASLASQYFRVGSQNMGYLYFDTTDGYVSTSKAGASLVLRSGNEATAMTLDSSQNATFAGRVKAGTAYGTAKSVEVNNAFIDQPQNTTKTVTVGLPQGVTGATFILDVGAYGNSGSGYGSLLIKGAGYLGSSTAYDAYEVVKVNSGNVTVSSVTKGNGQLTFTVINTAGTVSVSIKLTATAGDDITTIPAITIA